MCKLQSFPPMTDNDVWLEQFFIGKIIHEDWRNDQILIDSVSNGHQNLFRTMFNLARNKNPSRPGGAPGAPPDSALSKACGAGDLEAIKMIFNTVPTSHSAKIDALFSG